MIYILCTISDVFFATQSELFQGLNARRGAELSKKDLSDDLDQLLNTGLFANVDANVTPKKDGYAVEFVFREKIWPRVQTFRVAGATALPKHVELQVLEAAQKSQNCTVRVLATAKNIIENASPLCASLRRGRCRRVRNKISGSGAWFG